MMSTVFPCKFQPQPPLHPKTAGGKQRQSILRETSTDEETGCDSDHTLLTLVRLSVLDIPSSRAKRKVNNASVLCISKSNNSDVTKNLEPGSSSHSVKTETSNSSTTVNTNLVLENTTVEISSNQPEGDYLVCQEERNTQQSLTSNKRIHSTDSLTSVTSVESESHVKLNRSKIINVDNPPTNVTSSSTYTEKDKAIFTSDIETACSTSNNDFSFGSNFAYEHDHDYESVSSPCSSTASGPIYVRPPGFTYHAQEIAVTSVKHKLRKKKYSTSLGTLRSSCRKREVTPPRLKPKREPLPMKLRDLPQSFWQQPNVIHQVSPATLFLPPLLNKDSEDVMMDVRPVTPQEERNMMDRSREPERKVIVTNTDLLFKLFDSIGEGKKATPTLKSSHLKARKLMPKSHTKGLLLGNDPCMVDAVMENIFPQLTLESSHRYSVGSNTSLQLVALKEGDKAVTLPSLNLEQNYPQILSEFVLHI